MEKNLLSNGKIIFPNKLFIKRKINIGIIGSGKIAHEYARVINSFKHKITVIVSSSINKDAKKLAKKYRSKIYRDITKINNLIKIDAWIVCTSCEKLNSYLDYFSEKEIPVLIEKGILVRSNDIYSLIKKKKI